jgi:filamentous hemagglutinin
LCALVSADKDLTLQAAPNTTEIKSNNSSGSVAVGATFALGGEQNGISFQLGAQGTKGHANGTEITYTNTQVRAGSNSAPATLIFQSGGDTTLKGASATANTVKAEVGGNLNIQSLQDKSAYDSKQASVGAGISVCIPPICYGSMVVVSVNAALSKIEADHNSVGAQDEAAQRGQSGIKAGDGGFQVAVRGDTTLTGGVISSTQAAVDNQVNRFTTGGTLTTTDLVNQSKLDASSESMNVSVSSGGSTASGAAVQGSSGGSFGFGSVNDSQVSVARAGISGIASNQDVRTGDKEAGLAPVFTPADAARINRSLSVQTGVTAEFGRQAVPLAAKYADNKAIELRKAGNEAEAKLWDEGGAYRVALHGGIGLLVGGVGGAAGAATSAYVVPVIGEEIAKFNLPEPVRHALTDVVGIFIGATVGGTAGAVTALAQTDQNYVSHSPFAGVRTLVSQENARLQNECGANCTQADFNRIDAQMRELEMAANLLAISRTSKLTTEQSIRFAEAASLLIPYYGNAFSLYQAISGKTVSGTEISTVERFMSGLLVAIPVGTAAYKLISGAVADLKFAASIGGLSADGKALMDFSMLTNNQKGLVAEVLGATLAQRLLPGSQRLGRLGAVGSQGIDDLYKIASANADYVIVEYKFSTSPLKSTVDGMQMSDGWVLGSDRIRNLVTDVVEVANIRLAMELGRIEKWVVHTDPAGAVRVFLVDAAGKIIKENSALASKILGR